MATQQLLEKFEAICSPDSVFCLYTGLIERLVATNQALTVSDIWGGLDLRALDLELAIVDILRLLQSTRRCWRDSTEKLGQSTALRALREFMEVPQRAKFVLGLHDRVDALVSSCGEAFDSVGDLEGIKKGVDLWSRDCKRQLHYFTTTVAIGDEKGVFASQLKEAAGLGLVSELQELWELASFWMKQPARLTAGEQQLLNRVAQVMAKKELFKDYEGVDTLPAGLVRGDLLALVKKSSLPDWRRSHKHPSLLDKNILDENSPTWRIPAQEVQLDQLHPSAQQSRRSIVFGTWLDTPVVLQNVVPSHEEGKPALESVAKTWIELNHPNILKLYGLCDDYFVSEYAAHGMLSDYLNQQRHVSGGKSSRLVWQKLLEAAQGLQYLHERGLVHGNLIAKNLLVSSDGIVKLSGFGERGALQEVGTGDKRLADDVFALGTCIIQLVDGHITPVKWGKIIAQQPQGFTSEQWRLVRHIRNPVPDERLTIGAVAHDIKRLVDELSTNSQAPTSNRSLSALFQDNLDSIRQALNTSSTSKEYLPCELEINKQLLPRLSDVADQLVLEASSCIEGSGRSRRHGYAVQSWQSIVSRFQLLINEPFNRLASNRAVWLAVGRKSAQSVYELHRELDQLVSTTRLEKLVEAAATKDLHRQWETQWYTLRRQQAQVLCDKASDISAVLKEFEEDSSDKLDSGWARHVQGFWAVLEFERLRHPIKYTAEELGTIKRAASDIADTCTILDLALVLPRWFLPPYEVDLRLDKSTLGRGAFGSVHRGTWLDSPVVIKRVLGPNSRLDGMTTPSDGEVIFKHEADIWSRLNHPHVIALFGACHVGQPFFVCEYAAKGTLIDFLNTFDDWKNGFRQEMAWKKLYEAALGLEFLHERGVVHADLKGDNILIGEDGRAKLTDFGLSAVVSDGANSSGSPIGALRWKAPECMGASGQPATFASDIFSLGMCIIEAVTGTFPWGRELPDAAVSFHVRRGRLPPSSSAFSSNQWRLIQRMCSLHPQDRPGIRFVVRALRLASEHQILQDFVRKL
ncbi:hypothetical protein PC129_g21222 [Phytophthora cactorum]|uniref:Protein kinase domain-containing protein n=1 Tax=Phytophthora cactorum TaxID=29920 RepID=A0A329SRR6_9STRA|nr:hypothetical protein PC112_g21900 [Phytophthora cactorum]KAG2876182.1 hypothetical protein PC114_g24337 [Phytophthora cactorum]KAG2883225.1 hypothetical protein PC115_g21688 [Phytophthora cactorum]KAG2891745.1 hypothetical protein PC117_g24175 [Phytophthora cactorum]KAG2961845.1 hypothetical protein PC118_g21742 [Phytophthora cactorum]